MSEVVRSISVDKFSQECFDFLHDIQNLARWNASMERVELINGEKLDLGVRFRGFSRFLGRDIEAVYEAVEFEPDNKITIKSSQGPVDIEIRQNIVPKDGGTVLDFTAKTEQRSELNELEMV
jgi:carbon monoxide dehydrogenase subunit G